MREGIGRGLRSTRRTSAQEVEKALAARASHGKSSCAKPAQAKVMLSTRIRARAPGPRPRPRSAPSRRCRPWRATGCPARSPSASAPPATARRWWRLWKRR